MLHLQCTTVEQWAWARYSWLITVASCADIHVHQRAPATCSWLVAESARGQPHNHTASHVSIACMPCALLRIHYGWETVRGREAHPSVTLRATVSCSDALPCSMRKVRFVCDHVCKQCLRQGSTIPAAAVVFACEGGVRREAPSRCTEGQCSRSSAHLGLQWLAHDG